MRSNSRWAMNRRNLVVIVCLVASLTITTPSGLAQEPPPTANFDANPRSGWVPLTVRFTDQSTGNISSWDWNFDDGSAHSSEQNPTHAYNNPGDRTVSLTVSGPGGSSSKILLIHPFSTQWWFKADFTANPTSGTAPLSVQFTDQSSGLFNGRDWNFGDGSGHSAELNPLHNYTNAGDYTITLTISGPAGSHSKSDTIHVAAPPPPEVRYTLLKDSYLNVSCPNCGPPPPRPPAAMSGTFTLKLLDSSDPLVSRYQLTDVSFIAAGYGVQYRLSGEGTYQVGGKEALLRDMSLAVQIDSSTNKLCFFTNDYRDVRSNWPRIGPVVLTQTNGTAWEQYFLTISAAPAPRFTSVMPDAQTGNMRLQWQAYDAVQLERATTVTGPYSPVATNLTSQSVVDVGALTNQSQLYYRLRQQ